MARDFYSVEEIEARKLLSGTPSVVINYLDESGTRQQATSSGIDCYTDVPLHVTLLATEGSDAQWGTNFNDSTDSSNAAIKSQIEWNFGDPTSAYNVLPGFNAAHVYTVTGTYSLSLLVTNEDGYSKVQTVDVRVATAPFTDPGTTSSGKVYYVAPANIGTLHDGSSPTEAIGIAALGGPTGTATAIPDGSQVLFENGETFSVTAIMHFNHNNLLLSTWSSETGAPNTVIEADGSNEALDMSGANIVIKGLKFVGGSSAGQEISPHGANETIENCLFGNLPQNNAPAIDARKQKGDIPT